jgi:EpsD family peptidyl-prolyl cis-trans isomerase
MPIDTFRAPWLAPHAAAALAVALAAAACGAKESSTATQVAARVNKDEITVHQIGALLVQQPARPDRTAQAERQALERLIDRQLAVAKAGELKLDREPKVVQAIESARQDIIARAYADKLAEGVGKPSATDIRRYYDAHPALFAERKVYELSEIAVEADSAQIDALKAALPGAQSAEDVQALLQSRQIKFASATAQRAAEQLPLALLPAVARLSPGQSLLQQTARGAQVVVLKSAKAQPVSETQAARAIEQYLVNEQRRKLLADDLKALRATAKIEYHGRFATADAPEEPGRAVTAAEAAASAATEAMPVNEAPAANAGPAGATSATSPGIDASTLSKGLGLK